FRPADAAPPVFLTPDAALERLLHADDPAATVRITPWGVHTPGAPRDILVPERDIAVMIDGAGQDRAGMLALLEGITAAAPACPTMMFFAEAEAVRLSGLWPAVKRLNLVSRFTLTPDLEARRELALRGDALVLP